MLRIFEGPEWILQYKFLSDKSSKNLDFRTKISVYSTCVRDFLRYNVFLSFKFCCELEMFSKDILSYFSLNTFLTNQSKSK